MSDQLQGKRILLAVTGGISCYKAVEVLRLLIKAKADVHVMMTEAATKFVGPLTFRELSFHPVATDIFAEPQGEMMQHLSLVEQCDLLAVVPATANTMAKASLGFADSLVTTALLACTAPILMAPGMDNDMYENPVTQEHIARLKARGVHFIGPDEGSLARGNIGLGRLSPPERIVEKIVRVLSQDAGFPKLLAGRKVLVTSGPTQEPWDSVRYMTNRSSGKMGHAIAQAAVDAGADVTLVSGPSAVAPPEGARVVLVRTAEEMMGAVMERYADTDVVFKSAAVADYRFAEQIEGKMKKTAAGDELTVRLVKNPDILGRLGQEKKKQFLVGFAAETTDVELNAKDKLRRKGVDVIVANDVSRKDAGFETDTNIVTLFHADGSREAWPLLGKDEVARRLIQVVASRLS